MGRAGAEEVRAGSGNDNSALPELQRVDPSGHRVNGARPLARCCGSSPSVRRAVRRLPPPSSLSVAPSLPCRLLFPPPSPARPLVLAHPAFLSRWSLSFVVRFGGRRRWVRARKARIGARISPFPRRAAGRYELARRPREGRARGPSREQGALRCLLDCAVRVRDGLVASIDGSAS